MPDWWLIQVIPLPRPYVTSMIIISGLLLAQPATVASVEFCLILSAGQGPLGKILLVSGLLPVMDCICLAQGMRLLEVVVLLE